MDWIKEDIGAWWYKMKPHEINPESIYNLFVVIIKKYLKGVIAKYE